MGFRLLKYSEFNNYVNEGVIIVKRKYTNSYPEINKNLNAKIRNSILNAVSDKVVTSKDLLDIIAQAGSKNALQWLKQNGHYFKITKGDLDTETFILTPQAKRILQNL